MKGIEDAKRLIRQPYVWPGGYPLFAVMTDGGCLCHKCAKAEFRNIVSSHLTDARRDGWRVACLEVNWEDADLTCSHCGEHIETAHGDEEQS